MKAAAIDRFGPPSVLKLKELPVPEPAPNEVLIALAASGVGVWAYEFANPKGGFYAEYVAVNAAHVGHVPRRLDLLHAGAAAVTALTALHGVALRPSSAWWACDCGGENY